jgi:hypothetical protein
LRDRIGGQSRPADDAGDQQEDAMPTEGPGVDFDSRPSPVGSPVGRAGQYYWWYWSCGSSVSIQKNMSLVGATP